MRKGKKKIYLFCFGPPALISTTEVGSHANNGFASSLKKNVGVLASATVDKQSESLNLLNLQDSKLSGRKPSILSI